MVIRLAQPMSSLRRIRRPITLSALLAVSFAMGRCRATEYLTNDWSLGITTSSQTCPAIGSDGTIYFGTFTGRLWAVRPDGSRQWVFRAGLEIQSSPALGADGTIYFGSRDRKL